MPSSLQSVLGILVFLALAWALSEDRSRTPWWILLSGLVLQFGLAAMLLWLPPFKHVFIGLNDALLSLEEATRAGTSFVFGYLGGETPPFEETAAGSSFILAFRALPLILLVSALSALAVPLAHITAAGAPAVTSAATRYGYRWRTGTGRRQQYLRRA